MTKICTVCKNEKPIEAFCHNKRSIDGHHYTCKECKKIASHIYKEKNKEKIQEKAKSYHQKNKKRIQIYRKKYKTLNKKKISKQNHTYYEQHKKSLLFWANKEENKLKIKTYQKQYKQKTKLIRNKKEKIRRTLDLNYKIVTNLRTRIRLALKENWKSGKTISLLGCSIEFLKQHLEKQFKPGMNWQNYGEWHIDHIIPCAKFNLSREEAQHECFHYSNLQPLWEKENLKKGAK
jgi:hypothetical protein